MSRIYDMIKGLLPKKVSANSGNSANNPNVRKKNWRRYAKANRCFKKRKTVLGKYGCYAWNHLCEDNENQIYDNQQDWSAKQ